MWGPLECRFATLAHFHTMYLNICIYVFVKDKITSFYPDIKQSLNFNSVFMPMAVHMTQIFYL